MADATADVADANIVCLWGHTRGVFATDCREASANYDENPNIEQRLITPKEEQR